MKENKSVAAVTKIAEKYSYNVEKQIKELKRCVREGHKAGDILMVGTAYCLLAGAYYRIEDTNGILSNSLKAITLLKDTNEYTYLAQSYMCLGYAYLHQGNYQLSMVNDEIAYRIIQKHRIKGPARLLVLNNLSASYHNMGDYRTSVRILNECLELLKEKEYADDDMSNQTMVYINIAEDYMKIGDHKAAMDALTPVEKWIDKISYLPFVCDYYLRCALVSYCIGDVEEGNKYTDRALGLVPNDVYPLPIYDDLRALTHHLAVNGDRDRADRILGLMTVFAEKNTGTLEQLFAARTMADYYKQFGDFESAALYYSKYEELSEKRLDELNETQLIIHKTTQNTEREIRRLQRKMRSSEEMYSLEPLTKLLNRSALLRVSSEFIERAAKKRQKVGAIFIDIDYFKQCNDTYGHAKGDEIIKEVARACKTQETKDVRFARYGGDEFFGITKGLSDAEVCSVAGRICKTIQKLGIPNVYNPNGGIVTLSAGVANVTITDRTDTILEIANYADKALYYAKNAGRNAIYEIVYGDGADEEAGSSYVQIDF